jgi:hypothetical protein
MRALALCVVIAGCQAREQRSSSPPAQGSSKLPPSSPASKPTAAVARAAVPPLPDPLPGKRSDLTAAIGSAWRAAIGDFNGDNKRELVIVDNKQMRVIDATGRELASEPVTSGIHVLVAADIDGDGKTEILAGWGVTRDFRDAAARVTVHRMQGKQLIEDVVAMPTTERPEVVAIVPLDKQELLVAFYDSKYTVTSTIAKPAEQGWRRNTVASIRMATSYARGDIDGDGKPELVVGRIYGDDMGIDGDAFVLAPDGTRTMLPTTRGSRALAIAGGDVYLADGWHQNYGDNARGLLTRVHHDQTGYHAQLVEDTAGQYGIERILPATIDGKLVLVTLGSHYVRAFTRDGERWRGLTIAGAARDIAVGDLDGKPGDEIAVVGDTSALVDLRGVSFQ